MKSGIQTVLMAIVVLAMGVALVFGLNALGYANFKFFAPKVEQVRYDTFKESQAFNEGTVRELYAYQVSYAKATDGQKTALRGAILHQFSTYPKERLPGDLQQFYQQVQADAQR